MGIPSAHLIRRKGFLRALALFLLSLVILMGAALTFLSPRLSNPIGRVNFRGTISSFSYNTATETKQRRDKAAYPTSVRRRDSRSASNTIRYEDFPSFEVVATGYTAGFESTGKHPHHKEYGITYSGVKVRRDQFSTIAADLKKFPIGTILYIPGYGYGVVADTGSAIRGNKLDLYFETVEDVYKKWGKKKVKVYVMKRGDGKLTEATLAHYNESPAIETFLPTPDANQ